MYNILVVEDDKVLNKGLQMCLNEAGYRTESLFCADGVIKYLSEKPCDLIILDVNLPDIDGFEMCKEIRNTFGLPIIFLTARDEEEDILKGYDLGAEDYITKPFNINVFQKKILAIIKRCKNKGENVYKRAYLEIDFDKRDVKIEGATIALTPTEYRILEIFIENRNNVLTKTVLLEKLWDQNSNWVDEHALAVNISRLRGKIERCDKKFIKTVFGIGYMWNDNDEE